MHRAKDRIFSWKTHMALDLSPPPPITIMLQVLSHVSPPSPPLDRNVSEAQVTRDFSKFVDTALWENMPTFRLVHFPNVSILHQLWCTCFFPSSETARLSQTPDHVDRGMVEMRGQASFNYHSGTPPPAKLAASSQGEQQNKHQSQWSHGTRAGE